MICVLSLPRSFPAAGQGNCNVGAHSATADLWCYIQEDLPNGLWIDPRAACPDARASTIKKGKFWSNVACNTPSLSSGGHAPRNSGGGGRKSGNKRRGGRRKGNNNSGYNQGK